MGEYLISARKEQFNKIPAILASASGNQCAFFLRDHLRNPYVTIAVSRSITSASIDLNLHHLGTLERRYATRRGLLHLAIIMGNRQGIGLAVFQPDAGPT